MNRDIANNVSYESTNGSTAGLLPRPSLPISADGNNSNAQQDRVQLYVCDGGVESDVAVAVGSIAVTTELKVLVSEVANLLMCARQDLFLEGRGAWEVCVETGYGEGLLVGQISYDSATGKIRLRHLEQACPKTSFVYCEHLDDYWLSVVQDTHQSRLMGSFTSHLKKMMQYCALDNTHLTECHYLYVDEDVALELAQKRVPSMTRKLTVPVTLAMLVLGALLMGALRIVLWPEPFSFIGILISLMIMPVVASCGIMHLITQSITRRIAREILVTDLPVGTRSGRHEAAFSLGPEVILYRDEGVELRRERREVESFDETKRYVLVRLRGGKTIPIDKQAL